MASRTAKARCRSASRPGEEAAPPSAAETPRTPAADGGVAGMSRRRFRLLLGFNVAVSALCIFTHLVLNTAFAYVFQNTVFIYSLFVGVFLMSMGLGVLLVQRLRVDRRRLVNILLLNGVGVLLLANPGTFAVLYLNELLIHQLRSNDVDLLWVMFPLGVLLTVLVGIAAGAELPLFSKLIEGDAEERAAAGERAGDERKDAVSLTGVLATDYIGSFVGTVAFSFYLFPSVGLIDSIVFAQIAMLVVLDFMLFHLGALRRPLVAVPAALLNVYVVWSFFQSDDFMRALDAVSSWS